MSNIQFLFCSAHCLSSSSDQQQYNPFSTMIHDYFFLSFLADKMNKSGALRKHLKIQNPLKFLHVFERLSCMFLTVIPVCSSATALEDCRSFLQHHSLLLSSWPNLFIQQALNEPLDTSARTWAQGLVTKGGAHVMKWLNNNRQDCQHKR